MKRNLERFKAAAKELNLVKFLEQLEHMQISIHLLKNMYVKSLGIKPAPISTQTLQRDRHAHYMSTLH